MAKAVQVSPTQFILHKSDDEVDGYNEEQLFPDSVSEHNFVEGDTDLYSFLSYSLEIVCCFAHSKQLCTKDCLQDSEFLSLTLDSSWQK